MGFVEVLISLCAGACAVAGGLTVLYGIIYQNTKLIDVGFPALVIGLLFCILLNVIFTFEKRND